MRILMRSLAAVSLIAFGYALGNWNVLAPTSLQAQVPNSNEPSETTVARIQQAYEALVSAKEALVREGRYNPATTELNAFGVLSGGVDAIADLEAGRGVDPETFAGLYAGKATESVADHLSKDEQGRLMYKDKVIRIYPISRLNRNFAQRIKYSGLTDSNFLP